MNLINSIKDFYEDVVVGDDFDVVYMLKSLEENYYQKYEKIIKDLKKEKINLDGLLYEYNNYVDKDKNSYQAMIAKSVDRFLRDLKNDRYPQEVFYKRLYKDMTIREVSNLDLDKEYNKELEKLNNSRSR